jgi:DNA modification methylase
MADLRFKRDTEFRKGFFVPDSFSHPAKMDAQLLLWIVEHYTQPGEVILDPMFGSGTTMLACTLGRNVIGVELEQKFVDMAKANWEKVKQRPMLGYEMGECVILQGDARNLEGLLADAIISSPPYGNPRDIDESSERAYEDKRLGKEDTQHGRTQFRGRYQADAIVTSPPYAEAQEGAGIAKRGYQGPKHSPTDLVGNRSYMPSTHGQAEGQIGNLPYGSIDAVVTSPPYESTNTTGKADSYNGAHGPHSQVQLQDYRETAANIGNLKAVSYLEAMLQVYQQCYAVLRPQGLMILVLKNFIRNQQEVRLDLDTIKLCEQAGFELIERHYRKLAGQSFWRTIYRRKYPSAPVLDKEDILVFRSGDRAQQPRGIAVRSPKTP